MSKLQQPGRHGTEFKFRPGCLAWRLIQYLLSGSSFSNVQRLISCNEGQAAFDEVREGHRKAFSEFAGLKTPVVIIESPPQVNYASQVRSAPSECVSKDLTDSPRLLAFMKLRLPYETGQGTRNPGSVRLVNQYVPSEPICEV